MKTIPVSFMLGGMMAAAMTFAQTEGSHPGPPLADGGGKHGPPRVFVETWKAADKDHDGFLTKEEFDAMPRIQKLPDEKRLHLFQRLDKDNDGKLSREELGPMARPHGEQGPPMRRLWELDADKSGGINLEEFKAGPLFKKLPPERQDELFRRLDTNRDGMITPKDKPEPPFKHEGGNARPHRTEDGKPPVPPSPVPPPPGTP
jgi:Ca2+-binding EF-hand superfamily protein